MNAQLDLCLPRRSATEILDEELRDLVAELNAEHEPMRRVVLFGEITSLRNLLNRSKERIHR